VSLPGISAEAHGGPCHYCSRPGKEFSTIVAHSSRVLNKNKPKKIYHKKKPLAEAKG
jgi:hypothetical protein